MKRLHKLFSGLDFTRFFPVQHKATDAYYVIDVTENPDFDEATQKDKFRCYPVKKASKRATVSCVVLTREVLQPIPLML